MKINHKTLDIIILALFAGIIFILANTSVGFIQLGFIKATTIHIPVIIGSVLLGPKKGALLGFVFGLTSFISNTFTPVVMSFVFSPLIAVPGSAHGSLKALLICFIPRILVGIIPFYVYRLMNSLLKNRFRYFSFALAGLAGAAVNTLLVMNGIYLFFRNSYAGVKNLPVEAVYKAVLSVVLTNGIPEALVAGIVVSALCQALVTNKQIKDMLAH